MDTYSLLREFADSWFLIAMLTFFLGACLYALLSRREITEDIANIPFRHEDAPACTGDCANCACSKFDLPERQK
ncbi:cbb3-type cytochrome c oxidase subunit 3 [Actibacterium sp. 188UL27-1]|uniref:cbb3-type cytochrome c oxidase subunit 3 n=1 Tax=Actibacterium sp. 188UL27-1 TaxID=2786961 RepID=UPI0019584822|nr:cbb3-type cytochrome c oxidase subunit 3 [Actibacterium sp. 188UL27-1]MBM7068780.1 cbb3-type cytochrome c oxidase subunit 3 [Actibacterium sp. 188UL27-1]